MANTCVNQLSKLGVQSSMPALTRGTKIGSLCGRKVVVLAIVTTIAVGLVLTKLISSTFERWNTQAARSPEEPVDLKADAYLPRIKAICSASTVREMQVAITHAVGYAEQHSPTPSEIEEAVGQVFSGDKYINFYNQLVNHLVATVEYREILKKESHPLSPDECDTLLKYALKYRQLRAAFRQAYNENRLPQPAN